MKKIYWLLAAGVVLFSIWYLLIKTADYEVNFKVKTSPGDVIQVIQLWNNTLTDASIEELTANTLRQKISKNGHDYGFDWRMSWVDDFTTQVNIQITEPKRSVQNRLLIPFSQQDIETNAEEIGRAFYDIIKQHLELTKVTIVGEETLDSMFCLCTSLATKQTGKAFGMMQDYMQLSTFMTDNGLEPDGKPIVKINQWDHIAGTLKFDFCFPLVKTDTLPEYELFEYKQFESQKALKAIYNGNYITSDRTWYALLRYADIKGFEVTGLPTEQFYNNPNVGKNEKKWKAEIYLPVK